jgi:hypothetical protein
MRTRMVIAVGVEEYLAVCAWMTCEFISRIYSNVLEQVEYGADALRYETKQFDDESRE